MRRCCDHGGTGELPRKAGHAADRQLNAAYRRLRERLDAADNQRLVAAQRFWTQYRDANCRAERDLYQGGTAASPAYLACLEAMTRAYAGTLDHVRGETEIAAKLVCFRYGRLSPRVAGRKVILNLCWTFSGCTNG